ncbi:hypothetical protein ABPG75_007122 [Micractinium tetrahymenae]
MQQAAGLWGKEPCGPQGNGLILIEAVPAGGVVLRVPLEACLAVNYAEGLVVPPGQWPRLRKGVAKDDSLPWDVLLALALLDGLAGGGDAFWETYANAVLPAPLELTLPLCFPPALLCELQHGAIEAGARAQQERLAGLFPGLAAPMAESAAGPGPSWLQWGFACVRSRAFQLGDQFFAFAPFLDVANHEAEPTCDFRLSADGKAVELVAVKDLAVGQEATISYTGPQGMTNQRLMAQYGFVPRAGNPGDRLQFAALDAAAAAAGASSSSSSSSSSSGNSGAIPSGDGSQVLLSLDRMQACMSSGERMALAMSGRDPYAYAALKSLPFAADETAAAELSQQLALAAALQAELAAEAAAWPTSLAEDSALIAAWQQQAPAAGGDSPDPCLVAAVQYRMHLKALVKTCSGLLAEFVRGPPAAS